MILRKPLAIEVFLCYFIIVCVGIQITINHICPVAVGALRQKDRKVTVNVRYMEEKPVEVES